MSTPHESTIKAGRTAPGMTFHERVWAACAQIPPGKVATYGDLARQVGSPQAFRAVGQAMNRNPFAPVVPCHRVVGSDGSLTGFAHGVEKKRRMLANEGVAIRGDKVDLRAHRWQPE